MLPQQRILDAFASSPVCAVAGDHKAETLTALVDTIVPGPPIDDTPGGVQAGIDEPLLEVLQRYAPGVPLDDILVTELDRHAATIEPAHTFACLSHANRDRVIRAIEDSPVEQEQLVALLAVALPLILYYSEVGGEVSWPQVGFPGHDGPEGWTPAQLDCQGQQA